MHYLIYFRLYGQVSVSFPTVMWQGIMSLTVSGEKESQGKEERVTRDGGIGGGGEKETRSCHNAIRN